MQKNIDKFAQICYNLLNAVKERVHRYFVHRESGLVGADGRVRWNMAPEWNGGKTVTGDAVIDREIIPIYSLLN